MIDHEILDCSAGLPGALVTFTGCYTTRLSPTPEPSGSLHLHRHQAARTTLQLSMTQPAEESSSSDTALASESEAMRNEFRHLMMLLVLSTAYNSGNVPLLRDDKYKSEFSSQEDDRYRRVTHQSVLAAVATLFARNHEIVATTDIGSATRSPPALLTSVQVDVLNDVDPEVSTRHFNLCKNPHRDDQHFPSGTPDGYVLLPAGTALKMPTGMEGMQSWVYLFEKT